MEPSSQSQMFSPNIFFWKIFGMWPEENSSMYYMTYCFIFQAVTSVIYWFLFTLSLLFTPIELEIIIEQAMFYFTELAGLSKIGMIIMRRKDILTAFEMIDSQVFQGDDDVTKAIVNENKSNYKLYWKACCVFYNCGGFFLLFLPIIEYFIGRSDLELPLCQYYFLSAQIREKYYGFWFIYQFTGLFVLILCNVNIDTFICGLLLVAITQYKALNTKLENLSLQKEDTDSEETENKDAIMMAKLKNCLIHYDRILEYCNHIQDVMEFAIFAQFGTGAATICVSMCTFLRPMTNEDLLFMGCYIGAMTMEIFLPALLGAQLTKESEHLVSSAYFSDWTPQSESFKRSLRLLVERANRPVVFTGLKMFTLSLETFAKIVKMAYSLFTLLKNAQE